MAHVRRYRFSLLQLGKFLSSLVLIVALLFGNEPKSYAGRIALDDDINLSFDLATTLKNFQSTSTPFFETEGAIKAQISSGRGNALLPLGKIEIVFDGGNISANMSQVLSIVSNAPKNVFIFVPVAGEGGQIGLRCEQLIGKILPRIEYCNPELMNGLGRLQNTAQKHVIDAGWYPLARATYLPLMSVSAGRTSLSIETSDVVREKRIQRIDSNWKDIRVFGTSIKIPSAPESGSSTTKTIEVRYFDKVTWVLAVLPEAPTQEINSVVQRFGSILNVSAYYSAEDLQWAPVKKFSSPNDTWSKMDEQVPLGFEGDYAALLKSFHATDAVDPSCEGSMDTANTRVAIIDSEIAQNADLLQAVFARKPSGAELEKLKVIQKLSEDDFEINKHHGTYIASILASEGNDVGLRGIMPGGINVDTIVFPPARGNPEKLLKKELDKQANLHIMDRGLFLLAGAFLPYETVFDDEQDKYSLWARRNDGQLLRLRNSEARFKKDLNSTITYKELPFIIAAGQADGVDEEGMPIESRTPLAPQNIGDYDNVIVVAVCEECGTRARLWKRSNFNGSVEADFPAFVHIMAPGTELLPGYISESQISRTVGGSSAASAFVAGVAAKVQKCHKLAYLRQPDKLKYWLMVTSRPDRDETIGKKVAAGVVDPVVAMLSPDKNWLKRPDETFQAKSMNWCRSVIQLTGDGEETPIAAEISERVSRLAKLQNNQFAIFSSRLGGRNTFNNLLFESKGSGKLLGDEPLLSVSESGSTCTLRPTQVHDVILGSNLEVADCKLLEPCE